MFIYNLSGLSIDDSTGGPVEIEENETTARSATYQLLGRLFREPDLEHWERARDGRWTKELEEARALLPYELAPVDLSVPDDLDHQAHQVSFDAAVEGRLLGATYGDADRDAALEDIRRAYEYYGLAAREGALELDHLVSQCDYMQYITFKEAASASERLQRSYRRAQLEFLDNHLSWVSLLPGQVDDGLAGRAADLLAAFVVADRAYVAGLLE